MPDLPETVRIREVGPRDGFQNESAVIPTAEKIRLIDLLAGTGLKRIEVTSFVRPDVIPQLADASEVLAGIGRPEGVSFSVLVPNMRGLERALTQRDRFDEANFFLSASETHNSRNVNRSIEESLADLEGVAVAPGRGRKAVGVDLEHGQVGARVGADQPAGKLAAVGQPDGDRVGPGHHVIVGHDHAVGAHDHPGADRLIVNPAMGVAVEGGDLVCHARQPPVGGHVHDRGADQPGERGEELGHRRESGSGGGVGDRREFGPGAGILDAPCQRRPDDQADEPHEPGE
jgi:hypothetical protein